MVTGQNGIQTKWYTDKMVWTIWYRQIVITFYIDFNSIELNLY